MSSDTLPGSGITYDDVWLIDGCRSGFSELGGTLAANSATDLGIAVARRLLARDTLAAADVDMVIAASLAHTDFDAYYLPRHVGLYAGIPQEVPAIFMHRLCGSGFDVIAHAADSITLGKASAALCVGAEAMSRNPVASYTMRGGFRLGQVDFRDFLWEALKDTAPDIGMGNTAENLAVQYGISREDADAFAARSFAAAARAEAEGYFAAERVALGAETFELEGYKPRKLKLPRKVDAFNADEHARATPLDVLATLPAVFGGVQTAGNSSGIVDGAAAAMVARASVARGRSAKPLARVVASSAVGVPPEVMGIGPAPAIRKILEITGLKLDDIDRFEINEAFSAQYIAVERELGLDRDKVNVNGGATALGHPLAATGLRCTMTCAYELRKSGLRWGIASACCGGGQGSALLIENPEAS